MVPIKQLVGGCGGELKTFHLTYLHRVDVFEMIVDQIRNPLFVGCLVVFKLFFEERFVAESLDVLLNLGWLDASDLNNSGCNH